jgi:hypothetical protein
MLDNYQLIKQIKNSGMKRVPITYVPERRGSVIYYVMHVDGKPVKK